MAGKVLSATKPETKVEEEKLSDGQVGNGQAAPNGEMVQVWLPPIVMNANKRVTQETAKLAASSIVAIFQYGTNHYYGNVQQSALVSEIRQHLAKARNVKPSAIPKEDIRAYRKEHADWERTRLVELEQEALRDAYEGLEKRDTTRVTDPLAAKMRSLAIEEVRGILQSKNLSLPKDNTTKVQWGHDEAGKPIYRTRDEFIKNAMANPKFNLRQRAEDELRKEAEKLAEKVAAASQVQDTQFYKEAGI